MMRAFGSIAARSLIAVLPPILSLGCGADGGGFGGAVTLRGDSVTVASGQTGRVCVVLDAPGSAVAATQNELRWDPSCLTLQSCLIEPATGKQLVANRTAAGTLKAIVISLEDVNPIPDGPLYCCALRADQSTGCCSVAIEDAASSDPDGIALPTGASNGQVCVE